MHRDSLESIVNVVAGASALYALILAAKPPNREHPYGPGKVEFISAGIVDGLIVIAKVEIMVRALLALVHGNVVMRSERASSSPPPLAR